MGSTRSIVALAILAAACTKESGGGGGGGEKQGPQGDVRLVIGDCAGTDVAFVSGPDPRPPVEPVATSGGAFASLTGTGEPIGTFDDRDVYGGLLGNEVGEMQGGWGFGVSGVGPGGGPGDGKGWGTIGTGRYGTIGHGSGTGSGGMHGRRTGGPEVRIGNAAAQGDLDKNIIRRYVRRNLEKIRYCYEKQLLVKPSLAGTVKASFVIDRAGMVSESTAAGLAPEVDSCVAGVIKAIQFPKPKGDGVVRVNYPFTFRPADGTPPEPPREEETAALANLLTAEGSDGAEGDMSARRPGADLEKQIEGVRQEGQYKMKRNDVDPQLARQQAIDAAREAGIIGMLSTAGDPAAPLAPLGAGALGASSPLRGHEAALRACLRKQKAAYGVAVVDLTYDAAGGVTAAQVHGLDGAEVAACVSEAAKAMKRVAPEGAAQRCSVAFGTMPLHEAPGVDITADAILFGGKKLLDPAAVVMDTGASPKLTPLFDAASVKPPDGAPVTLRGPTLIRPISDARMKVVNRVLATLVMTDSDPVLAAQDGGGWRTLPEVVLPVVPVPQGTGGRWLGKGVPSASAAGWGPPPPRLSILLTADRSIRVGTTTGEQVQIGAAASQPADLDKALRDHKAGAFKDRSDLEIAAEDEVTYGDVVKVIDAAARAGFVRWEILDPMSTSVRFKK